MSNRLGNTTNNGLSLLSSDRSKKNLRRQKFAAPTLEQLEPRVLLSVPSVWTCTGPGGTGTTYYPTFNPNTSTPGTELWVGTDMGQTFHTTDFTDYADTTPKLGHVGQVDWNTPGGLQNLLPEYGHSTNIVYGWAGGNLERSTDSGVTWSTSGVTTPSTGIIERSQLFVDRTDANDRMIALGADNKAYISTNAGVQWTAINGGSTVAWISGVTWNGTDVYVGINDYLDSGHQGSDSTRGLLKGTYSGGNWSWSWVTRSGLDAGTAFTSVVGLMDGGTLRFMALGRQKDMIGNTQGSILDNNSGHGTAPWKVYSWSVGDASWVDRSGSLPTSQYIFWVRGGQLTGGTPTFYLAGNVHGGPANVFKGTWSGSWSGWTDVLDGTPATGNVSLSFQSMTNPLKYVAMFNMQVCPDNPDFLVFTNDNGVYGSTTGAAHWADIACDRNLRNPEGVDGVAGQFYSSSLNETSVWGLTFIDQNNIFANNTDYNGSHSVNGGLSWASPVWAPPYDGWHFNTTYKSTIAYDGTILATESGTHDTPADQQFCTDGYTNYAGYGGVLASTDKGTTFVPVLAMTPTFDFINRAAGFASKMNGGYFQGANQANFSDAVTLYTINGDVPYKGVVSDLSNYQKANDATWNASVNSNNTSTAFRYFRYVAPAGSWGEIGQMDFFDAAGNPLSLKSGVTVIGAGGVYGGTDANANNNYGYQRAFDLDPKAPNVPQFNGYHKAAAAGNTGDNWVGIDLGAGNAVAISKIAYQAPGTDPMIKAMVLGPQGTAYADRLYVAVSGTDPDQVSGVWYSDNWRSAMGNGSPTSVTWTHLSSGLTGTGSNGNLNPNGAVEDIRALDDGTLILIYHNRWNNGIQMGNAGIWVLPAGQTTWVNRTLVQDTTHDMTHQITDVVIDPSDASENTWWVCAENTDWYGNGAGLYKTTNRGVTWTKPFDPTPTNYPGTWSIGINPLTGEIFMTGSDGSANGNGLYYSASSTNPSFSMVTTFPKLSNVLFRPSFNPWKPNDLWLTTFGAGIYHADATTVVGGIPAAPTNLAVTSASGTTYSLQWTDNATNESYFKVEYAPVYELNAAGQPKWTLLETLGANSGTGTMTRNETIATGDKRYYFRVTAVNASGSAYSNVMDAAIPTAPTIGTCVGESSSSVIVNWTDNSHSETSYKIEYYNGSWVTGATAASNATSCTVTGNFAAGTQYNFRVTSVFTNDGGTVMSNTSGTAYGTTLPGASTSVCDTFNYTTSTFIGLANGGFGWSSPWKSAPLSTISSNSLSYSASGTNLCTAGNKLQVQPNATITRDLANPLSGVVWIGAAITKAAGQNASIQFKDKSTSTGALGIGTMWYNSWMILVQGGGYSDQGPAFTNDVTHLMVIKLDLTNPNNITVNLYVDPTPGTQPLSPTCSLTGILQSQIGTISQLAFNGSYLDEIRVGSSYADVAPSGTGGSVPTITVAAQDGSASEVGPDIGVYRVTRSGATGSALSVYYTMGGQATNGTDYNTLSGTATIGSGSSYVDITLTPINDTLTEGSETAVLTLSANANYAIGTPGSNTVTIADDDSSSGLLYASDDFNYSTGTINGSSQNTGTGFSDAWTNNGAGYTFEVASGNLSYSTLSTLGNKLHMKAWTGGAVSRTSSTTFGADGQVIWVSFIMNVGSGGTGRPYAGLSLGNISLGSPTWQGGDYNVIVGSSTGGTGTLARGTDTYVVAKITYGSTDHVDMWINPTLGSQPTVGSGTYVGVDGSVGNTTAVAFTAGDSSMDDYFDRLRIGDSWAAVSTGGGGSTPTVSVTAQDASAGESGPDTGTYRITRTGATTSPLTVLYAMSGQATNGTDYNVLTGTATISSGSSYVDVLLAPIMDPTVEGSETAIMTVSANAAYTVGSPSTSTVTIADSLTVTEDFNYTGSLSGKGTTGNGWTGSWTSGGGTTATTGSLAFSKNGYGLFTSNNKAEATHQDTASRNLSTALSGTQWYSFMFQQNSPGSCLKLSSQAGGTTNLIIGDSWGYGSFVWLAGTGYGTSSCTIAANTTYFVVVKLTIGAPNDHVTVYVNPTPGLSAPETTSDVQIFDFDVAATNVGTLDKVTICGTSDYNNGVADYDEFRVGNSYAAVAQSSGLIPTVTISNVATDNNAAEQGQDPGVFQLTRDGSTSSALTVYYGMTGTATNAVDYNSVSGTATIAAGSSYVNVTITPIDDTIVEGTETAILTLSQNAAYQISGTGNDTVYIADNDLPVLTVTQQDASASEIGPDTGTLRISRTGPTTAPMTVYYTMSGQATNGTDYTTLSGTATIAAGSDYIDVTITPVDDANAEGSETAILTVSANANYVVGSPSNNTVTIADSCYVAEDFNYSVGAVNGSSQSGGFGMSGAWANNGQGYTFDVVTGNLTYSTLSSGGNKLHMKAWTGGVVSRNSTTTFGADGQVIWVSFLMNIGNGGTGNPYAGFSIGSISLGSPTWQGGGYNVIVGSSTGGTGTLARGVDTWVVAKITYGSTDHVDMWINPVVGSQPTVGSGTYVGVDGSVGTSNVLGFDAGDSSMDNYFDRLRIGATWTSIK